MASVALLPSRPWAVRVIAAPVLLALGSLGVKVAALVGSERRRSHDRHGEKSRHNQRSYALNHSFPFSGYQRCVLVACLAAGRLGVW